MKRFIRHILVFGFVVSTCVSNANAGDELEQPDLFSPANWTSQWNGHTCLTVNEAERVDSALSMSRELLSLVDDYERLLRIYEEENGELRDSRRSLLEVVHQYDELVTRSLEREEQAAAAAEEFKSIAELNAELAKKADKSMKITIGTVTSLVAALVAYAAVERATRGNE